MIHPEAIDDFLTAPRDSFVWVKKISEAKLDRELAALGFISVCPDQPLDKHQKACIWLGIAYPRFGYWLDMGTGKTRIVLELVRYFWLRKELKRLVILVPSEDGVWSWEKQIKLWQIDIPYVTLGNSPTADKWASVEELDAGLIIASYAGFAYMLSKLQKVDKKRKKAQRQERERIPDIKAIQRFAPTIDGIVPDESTKLGNRKSLIFRIVDKVSEEHAFFWELAGRPLGRDRELIWSQQYLIDRGESLGDTLGMFRAAFFKEKRGHFSMYEYKFDESKEELLAAFMQHRAITYASSECFPSEHVERIIDEVSLPADTKGYYDKAVEMLKQARGDYRLTKNIFLRMRQLSSGFLGMKDDETGERAQLVFPTNPKLERLLERIDDMPLDRKALVFYDFTHSGRTIVAAIEKRLKIKCGWIWSGTPKAQRAGFQDRFEDDPKLRVAVLNNRIGAMTLNLQSANYEFFYESPLGAIERDQAEKRAFRKGQKLPGFLYDLVVKGTADMTILVNHKEGGDIFRALLRAPYGIVEK